MASAARACRPAVVHRAASPVRVAITGAMSYSGRYMSELLADDPNVVEVRSMTNHPHRKWEGVVNKRPTNMTTVPLKFDDTDTLQQSLEGVDVLICTYWTRFSEDDEVYGKKTAAAGEEPPHPAVLQVKALVDAAVAAGVRRMIYMSHTKPSLAASAPQYIRGKTECEEYIKATAQRLGAERFSYGFVRPCCIFGDTANESIVANNTAYMARRLPVLLLPGSGRNYFQPVHVRDLAEMCVNLALWPGALEAAAGEYPTPPQFLDAVGPEKLTITQFMRLVGDAVHEAAGRQPGVWGFLSRLRPRPLLMASHLPAGWIFPLLQPMNHILDDVYVEEGDLQILTDDIACSERGEADVQHDVARVYADASTTSTDDDADTPPLMRYPAPPAGGAVDYNLWGRRPFSDWVRSNADTLGVNYINSYARYYDCSGMRAFKRIVAEKRAAREKAKDA